jgi:purine-binding chemotaxis protein CheW
MQLNAKRARQNAQKSLVAFVVGNVKYALEIGQVKEIVSPLPLTLLPHTPIGLAGVADHRAEVVPIVDLRNRFNVSIASEPTKKSKWILVDIARRTIGLVVDEVIGVLRVPAGDFRAAPDLGGGEQERGIAGVTTYEGELVFVLDLDRFGQLAESFDQRRLAAASEAAADHPKGWRQSREET